MAPYFDVHAIGSSHDGPSLGDWFTAAVRAAANARPQQRVAHSVIIQRVVLSAIYDELNCRTECRWTLQSAFANWGTSTASEVATKLHLPRISLRDLEWSREMWEWRGRRGPVLEAGFRMYPGAESDAGPDELERLGYVPWPPRLRNSTMLRKGARRLVAYVVDGLSYARIVEMEDGNKPYPVDTRKVRRALTQQSRITGIAIPKRPRGRPRK